MSKLKYQMVDALRAAIDRVLEAWPMFFMMAAILHLAFGF
jgi:hypothetical protein